MTTNEEKEFIERIRNSFSNTKMKSGIRMIVSDEEYNLCLKYGIGDDKVVRSSKGFIGQFMKKLGNNTGTYTPNKGFYKIIEVKVYEKVPDGRVFEQALITNFDANSSSDFSTEDVLINTRPFFNRASIGPKSTVFKVGMIIHVTEETTLINNTYRVVWTVLEKTVT